MSGLLSDAARLLLRAISSSGADSVAAYSQWRAIGPLDAAHGESHRVLPLLVELIQREGIDDPDLARMRGVAKQVWTHNVLRLRLLFSTLDALESRGIDAVLMKGAALFARIPELERRRVSADYDILVRPDDIPAAVDVLRGAGFLPPGHAWEDFGSALIDSVDAGVEIKRGNQRGLDLHWRPLWNIRDPELGGRYWAGARGAELHGRAVRIPSPAHQLFCAMARCEPWDRIECFTRVTEGYFLLTAAGADVDWHEFAGLTRRYGFECTAAAYLGELGTYAGLALPKPVIDEMARAVDDDRRREWSLRAIPPGRRSSSEHIALQRRDFAFGRSGQGIMPPEENEERLRAATWPSPSMNALWRLARRRISTCAPGAAPVFLEGFSSPERDGRWTDRTWALAVVPLTEAQRAGEPLRLNAHAHRGLATGTRLVAAAGKGVVRCLLNGSDAEAKLEVRVRPLPELDGRGLLLLWLPDAIAPAEVGGSTDKRRLGLFIRRQWDRRADGQPEAPRGDPSWLRRWWRQRPLPAAMRERISPAVAGLARRVRLGRLPPPLAPSAIGSGNIIVSASLSDGGAVGRAARLALATIQRWPGTVLAHDPGSDPAAPGSGTGEGGIWIGHCAASDAARIMLAGTAHLWAKRYRVGIWSGEMASAPEEWAQILPMFHEIWVHDEAAAAMVRGRGASGPAVRVVSHPLPVASTGPERTLPADRPFRFVALVDMRSLAMRAAAIDAVRAFQSAFERGSRTASLVLSIVEAGADPVALDSISHSAAGWPNIALVTKALTDGQMLELLADAECLLMLREPEGTMQPIVEAVSQGTPILATGWPVPPAFLPATLVVDQAGPAMQRLCAEPSLWAGLSQGAMDTAAAWRRQPWPESTCRRFMA